MAETGTGENKNFFLDVKQSIRGQAWVSRLDNNRTALAISQRFGLSEIVGRILAGRQVELDMVDIWLNPTLRELMPAPETVVDLIKGAQRIVDAVQQNKQIAIIGDYDVDGISSTSILTQFLTSAGAVPLKHIPDRAKEGYGPSIYAVEKLQDEGAEVLVTLDCGTASHAPLARAKELGLDVVVVDHHQVPETMPDVFALINPNRNDDLSGLGNLCAAGVTMMLIGTLNKMLRENDWWSETRPGPDILQYLDLVALATVCDVVPLTGLNRAFVRQGLKVMASRKRVGLTALADAARLVRKPDVYALGFIIGPRLNAAGRIGSAMVGVDLMTTSDKGKANAISMQLENWNRERQAIELGVVDRADMQAQKALGETGQLPVLVVSGQDWHPGVLGLAAARLKERYHVPSFVLGFAKGSDEASGSGRSIKGVDLGGAIQEAVKAGIVKKGGGHAMAAGLTVGCEQIGDLRAFLEDRLAEDTAKAQLNQSIKIDAALTASGATIALIEQIEMAGPFGSANPSPMFAFPAHRVVYADIAGTDHVRCTLASADGSRIKAIAFRVADTELGELLLSERSMPLHFAGKLAINDWGGRREPQLFIEDVARA